MALTPEKVKSVAELIRLELDDAEIAGLTQDMTRILEFAASLERLDTTNIEPTTHAVEVTDVLRKDEPRTSLDREKVLASAPESEGGCFVAPRIV